MQPVVDQKLVNILFLKIWFFQLTLPGKLVTVKRFKKMMFWALAKGI